MQIEIGVSEGRVTIAVLAVVLITVLVAVGLLGKIVTPMKRGEHIWLTPERWQAAALERAAHAETEVLQSDYTDLRSLLEQNSLDPVEAMLLAQHIYADNRSGTSATATARQALIDAAATTAQFAAGSVNQESAVTALNQALNRIENLSPNPAPTATAGPEPTPTVTP